jgi:hypothetical protein
MTESMANFSRYQILIKKNIEYSVMVMMEY